MTRALHRALTPDTRLLCCRSRSPPEETEMSTILGRWAVALAAIPALAIGLTFVAVSAQAADFTSELAASDGSGVPEGYTS